MEFVTGAISSLLPKLGELLLKEYNLHKDMKDKIESLSAELRRAHAVLRMVGEVPLEQHTELVRLWASDLREASYDMEDIIDSFLLLHVDGGGGGDKPADPRVLRRLGRKVKLLFKKTKHRHNIAGAIQDMEKKLEEVTARHGRYSADKIAKPARPTPVDPRILNIERMAKDLVGIGEPRDELIKMLSHDEKTKTLHVVGMGGLGKTTLATAVYEKLKPDFPWSAFVPVGQNPDMKKILWYILTRLDKDKHINHQDKEMLNVHELILELKEFIKGKRFLIVIDDVWEKSSWELLEKVLQYNECGSRVIVTTRNSKVATIASDVYNMKPLSHENSKELLYTRIAGGEGSSSAEACDKILKKCAGVPLAIITIASLLATRPGQDWFEVYNAIGFGEEDNDEVANTISILSFSYYDLPSHLKTCLLYLSMFPEDYEIKKNILIWRWIAEGFVQRKNTGLYELGESYFNELINRSMIQPIENEDRGYIYGCPVHDMVLHLARSLSSEQNFVTVLDNDEQRKLKSSNARRFAMHRTTINSYQSVDMDVNKVRTFVAVGCKRGKGNNLAPPTFQVLRVLDLERCDDMADYIESSLKHVGRLCHLRYLRLDSYSHFVKLPKELCDLRLLKVLELDSHSVIDELGLLQQLLCLRITHRLQMVPAGLIRKLTLLQELYIYIIHEESVRRFVKELGNLRELRVLEAVLYDALAEEDTRRDLLQSISCLNKLHTMSIYGSEQREGTSPSCHRLWQLSLPGVKFFSLPAWINSSTLGCLSHLELRVHVVKEQAMETLGSLPMCYLELDSEYTRLVTIKKPADGDYFQKLRLFITPSSFVRFDMHGCESSSGASTIMPILESLLFRVDVRFLKDADLSDGFDGLLVGFNAFGTTSLRKVTAMISCNDAFAAEVQEAEEALEHAANNHPNRPILKTNKDQVTTRYVCTGQQASLMEKISIYQSIHRQIIIIVTLVSFGC
uniref:AAA+ ATPase domain-containing protein n=1 Tax=Oryza brachyantha TaxID=4533 RepID=J3MQC6_ORYBR